MFKILPSGEVESTLRKQHRNQTNGQKPRVSLGTKHGGILEISMNAKKMEVGYLEVMGNPVEVNITKRSEDMEKLLKGL